jgi:tetratricopeptide (TPR) repeat protein
MATPFLSSEEYDERAHHLYNVGDYDSALRTLKEGLAYYPHSVELYVGMAYARLAREEFVWAKQAFEKALVLDPDHEDAQVGLGEVLLRFGRREEALESFGAAAERVRETRWGPRTLDVDLLRVLDGDGDEVRAGTCAPYRTGVASKPQSSPHEEAAMRRCLVVASQTFSTAAPIPTPRCPTPAASVTSVNRIPLAASRSMWGVR